MECLYLGGKLVDFVSLPARSNTMGMSATCQSLSALNFMMIGDVKFLTSLEAVRTTHSSSSARLQSVTQKASEGARRPCRWSVETGPVRVSLPISVD